MRGALVRSSLSCSLIQLAYPSIDTILQNKAVQSTHLGGFGEGLGGLGLGDGLQRSMPRQRSESSGCGPNLAAGAAGCAGLRSSFFAAAP